MKLVTALQILSAAFLLAATPSNADAKRRACINVDDPTQSDLQNNVAPANDVWTGKNIDLKDKNGKTPSIKQNSRLWVFVKFEDAAGKRKGLKLLSGTGDNDPESLGFVFKHNKFAPTARASLDFEYVLDGVRKPQNIITKPPHVNSKGLKQAGTRKFKYRGDGKPKPRSSEGKPGEFREKVTEPFGTTANDFDATDKPTRRFHDYVETGKHVIICSIALHVTPKNINIPNVKNWEPISLEMSLDAWTINIVDARRRLDERHLQVEVCEDCCEDDGEMGGEPHIKTWGGTWFDYMGECDLVLLHVEDFEPGLDLTIHVRTTIRYNYSFIESAAIRIGDDTLEVESFGQYALNGVDNLDLQADGVSLAGYPIFHSQLSEKQHVFDILISPYEMITISTFKDIVSVKIHDESTRNHYDDSVGLMGSFGDGAMLARNGTTEIADPTEFGQEWQVKSDEPMLFRTVRAPQQPQEKCILPAISTKEARRLGEGVVSKEEAQMACAHLEDHNRDNCVYDVLAIGDLDIAQSVDYQE